MWPRRSHQSSETNPSHEDVPPEHTQENAEEKSEHPVISRAELHWAHGVTHLFTRGSVNRMKSSPLSFLCSLRLGGWHLDLTLEYELGELRCDGRNQEERKHKFPLLKAHRCRIKDWLEEGQVENR